MLDVVKIEKPCQYVYRKGLVIFKPLLLLLNVVSTYAARRILSVKEDVAVIKLNSVNADNKKIIIDIAKTLQKEGYVVSCVVNDEKSKTLSKDIVQFNSKSVLAKVRCSTASVVILYGEHKKIPYKKYGQVYIGFNFISDNKKINRVLDFVCDNKKQLCEIFYYVKRDVYWRIQYQIKLVGYNNAFRKKILTVWQILISGKLGKYIDFLADHVDYAYRNLMRNFVSKLTYFIPVSNNLVVVYNNFNQYSCNIKYVSKEIKNDARYNVVYLIKDFSDQIKKDDILQVDPRSIRAILLLARAKVWIFNSIKQPTMPLKKKSQIFIQTWHGSLGLKRVDPEYIYDKSWLEKAFANDTITDICVANSIFEEEMYKSTYWTRAEIWKIGHPRNDILFRNSENLRYKICKQFSIPCENFIFLYAPTYREDYSAEAYLTDFGQLKKTLKDKFNKNVTICVRYHHWFIKRASKTVLAKMSNDGIVNLSDYPDMQELMVVADAGCTDYSSWIYDFVLTGKPGFIFASDIEQYLSCRGFYYSLTETPFSLSKNIKELCDNIKKFDSNLYKNKVEVFLKNRGCYENGHATKSFKDKLDKLVFG